MRAKIKVLLAIGCIACIQAGAIELGAKKPDREANPESVQAEDGAYMAARLSGLALSAAAAAQAAGLKSDPASLSRMGALPVSLMKWGQLSSPWMPGEFMDVEISGTGRSARVALVIASIPKATCVKALDELSMQTTMERMEVQGKDYPVGEKWKIEDAGALCESMRLGPVKLWAATVPQAAPSR